MIVAAPASSTLSMLESLPTPSVVSKNSNSDEVCQNRIQHLLHGARPEFRHLQVTSNRGIVTVAGRVASFYHRQLAIQCCQKAAGSNRINDQLQVETA
jgi:osmotically-inducible protein OsmY